MNRKNTGSTKQDFRIDGRCFAIVNHRLAEIYFKNDTKSKKSTILAHAYIKREEFTSGRRECPDRSRRG